MPPCGGPLSAHASGGWGIVPGGGRLSDLIVWPTYSLPEETSGLPVVRPERSGYPPATGTGPRERTKESVVTPMGQPIASPVSLRLTKHN